MKSKSRKIASTITNFLFTLVLIIFFISTFILIDSIHKTPSLNVSTTTKKVSSKIYDYNDKFVTQLDMEDYGDVTYDMLPDVFINALISCEDIRFFIHDGIDIPRILSAIKNDVLSFSLKEGASTLTQQLVKNMMLTNTKSLQRKIQEVYLANKIEKIYDKKQILEFYCNFICFDGVNHGVSSATYKFFNKHISQLTLPEAALLVGVVNAPSAYSPILNPSKANERKNIVLTSMYNHGYINKTQLDNARKITCEDMIVKAETKNDDTYRYQSYIDVVYKQIYEKTGYDPYITPMEIYTNMDSALQRKIDSMQDGALKIENNLQQFAACVIENKSGYIKGVFGGKNYNGKRLLNRAYDINVQPASTIKIPLNYALSFEHLNWSNKHTLLDVETTYPNSAVIIKNVDNKYMGEINISQAIGYSRNTVAISSLEKVVNKIGINNVIDYLNSINLMDNGIFSYSYGLGGYTYGVSLTNLAAAYSMIARYGLYIEPLSIRKIKLLDESNKIIEFTPYTCKVLSDSTCYLLIDVLDQVMKSNYWSIQSCRPENVNVYAKSGTTSFDKSIANKYNIPPNASKDKLLASFSKDYTIACWTGFDEIKKNSNTYFKKGSNDELVVKTFTKNIYEGLAKKDEKFIMPDSLTKVSVVKGSDLLATDQVKNDYIEEALYKKEYVPTIYFEEPSIENIVNYDYFIIDDNLNFIFTNSNQKPNYNIIFDYEKILGEKQVFIDVYEDFLYKNTFLSTKIMTIPLKKNSHYKFDIYYKYENGFLEGVKSALEFTYN